MAGEKDTKKSEPIVPGQISDSSIKLPEKDMVKDGRQSDSVSSVSGIKGVIDYTPASEQGAYYPPTSCYDYYYPVGYNGTFTQSEDKGYFNTAGGPYTGIQSSDNNTSLVYYVPGYSPYPTGYVGPDGEQAFTSSEYHQQPTPYGSEAFSSYTYDSTYTGNGLSGTAARSANMKSLMAPSGSGKSNGYSTVKTNNNYPSKTSPLHFNSKFQQQPASNFSKPLYQNNPIKPLNKFSSGYQSADLMRGYHPTGKFSMITDQNRRFYLQQGPVSYQSNGSRVWNNNFRQKPNFGRSGEFESSSELTRGPRGDNRNNSMKLHTEVEMPALAIERSVYNTQDFQIDYDNAKFYVIKSYSEDDIHKCIKYGVWSSTPNGNKKLDAAFREADGKAKETGVKCPIFLFFSVNGSGQFVGVAEMIGQVDFSKKMDFWQLDKWNGFFPIKWHIIKDVPNSLLRHIILENNENRAVTYSRDTQEVGLKEGLEILGIFKNYSEKTSVLDDFNFYENREKSLKAKRSAKQATLSQSNGFDNGDFDKHLEVEGATGEKSVNKNPSDASSLVSLTKNLSINSQMANST